MHHLCADHSDQSEHCGWSSLSDVHSLVFKEAEMLPEKGEHKVGR